jgi:protease I
MTTKELVGKKVAILATNGVEQVELTEPRNFLKEHGATVHLISIMQAGEQIQGCNWMELGDKFTVDKYVEEANPDDYNLLLLPGGTWNPDSLRISDEAISFIKRFAQTDKLIAAICHSLWMLINAELVKGKRITSFPTIRKDLENAGAIWVDQEVVVDGNIITSRSPLDLDVFNKAILNALKSHVK